MAGVCDESGRILGLMPHPEAATNKVLRPNNQRILGEDIGIKLFKNAVQYFQ